MRPARAEQDNGTPYASHCCKGGNTVTIASTFPRSYNYGHYYASVDHCYAFVVMMYACMRCVCAPCTCKACARVCPCVTHAINSVLALGYCVFGRTRKCKYLSYTPEYIPVRCLHFPPLIGRANFCSTQSLSGNQQQPMLNISPYVNLRVLSFNLRYHNRRGTL